MKRSSLLGVLLPLFACATLNAQSILAPGTQIETQLRPITTLRFDGTVGGTPETRTAVGIFDTGDPNQTFSKETARLLQIQATTTLFDCGSSVGTLRAATGNGRVEPVQAFAATPTQRIR